MCFTPNSILSNKQIFLFPICLPSILKCNLVDHEESISAKSLCLIAQSFMFTLTRCSLLIQPKDKSTPLVKCSNSETVPNETINSSDVMEKVYSALF